MPLLRAMTSTRKLIGDVFFLRTGNQMSVIAAAAIVAGVPDNDLDRQFAMDSFVNSPMRIGAVSIDGRLPISPTRHIPLPWPTSIRSTRRINEPHKVIETGLLCGIVAGARTVFSIGAGRAVKRLAAGETEKVWGKIGLHSLGLLDRSGGAIGRGVCSTAGLFAFPQLYQE
jgi:hypothetical protein